MAMRCLFQKASLRDAIDEASKAYKIRNCCGPPSKNKVK